MDDIHPHQHDIPMDFIVTEKGVVFEGPASN
jgi:5-formyltetrahydrofolate cyclo-ligase